MMDNFWQLLWDKVEWISAIVAGILLAIWRWAKRIKDRSYSNKRNIEKLEEKVDKSIEEGWSRLDELKTTIEDNEKNNSEEHKGLEGKVDDMRKHFDSRLDKLFELLAKDKS